MKVTDAEKLLAIAPRDARPSRVNPSLTTEQATSIIEKGIVGPEERAKWGDRDFPPIYELRVYQAACNLRRPNRKSRDRADRKAGLA